MRAILINPWNRTVTEVDHTGDDICNHLSQPDQHTVGMFTATQFDGEEALYLDDEGFLVDGVPVWRLDGNPHAGRGLILGTTEAGNSRGSRLTVEDIQNTIIWTDKVTTGEFGPSSHEQIGDLVHFHWGEPILRVAGKTT